MTRKKFVILNIGNSFNLTVLLSSLNNRGSSVFLYIKFQRLQTSLSFIALKLSPITSISLTCNKNLVLQILVNIYKPTTHNYIFLTLTF